ncbi:hypothetical protein CDAR_564991 [Caerostris darwini]|uniref:Uncharacterized protein n=1 Tax=Caerostris darwini TaxID=1538125 RepID=A0AAV4USD8_9ARAC|nr:hypothetical protein CDAR_564991 [Caerostris darwini]
MYERHFNGILVILSSEIFPISNPLLHLSRTKSPPPMVHTPPAVIKGINMFPKDLHSLRKIRQWGMRGKGGMTFEQTKRGAHNKEEYEF